MVHVPEGVDPKSAAKSGREGFASLFKIAMMFILAGPALYGVVYFLLSGVMGLGKGQFQWSELSLALLLPFFMEVMFWVSWGSFDSMLLAPLPTVLAAIGFWLLNKAVMPSADATTAFRFVFSRSLAGLVVCVCAFVALNPATVTQGWNALYFYNPDIRPVPDYSEWGLLDKYGQLFHLAVLGLAGALLGAIYGLSSWWFDKSLDN
jgi:hypothetical protein